MLNQSNLILIKNTNIITMESEDVLYNHDILIENEIIKEIQPTGKIELSSEQLIVDGTNRYTLPGLMDMHVHLMDENQMILYLANGITTIRNMWGFPRHLKWQERIEHGDLLCPNIFTTSPIIDAKPYWPNCAIVNTPDNAKKLVKIFKDLGYKQIKIYFNLTREVYDALIDAGREHNIPIVGHVPWAVGLEHALQKRQYAISHLDGYLLSFLPEDAPPKYTTDMNIWIQSFDYLDESRIPSIIKKAVDAGVWHCPTLVVHFLLEFEEQERLLSRPETRFISPEILDAWDLKKNPRLNQKFKSKEWVEFTRKSIELKSSILGKLYQSKGKILVGTDALNPHTIPGFAFHDELERFVSSGISPYETLKCATKNAAEFIGCLDKVGTVSVGKRADLLILNANPIEIITNTKKRFGLVFRGRWISQEYLNDQLEKLTESFKQVKDYHNLIEKEFQIKEPEKILKYDGLFIKTKCFGEQLAIQKSNDNIIHYYYGKDDESDYQGYLIYNSLSKLKEATFRLISPDGDISIILDFNDNSINISGKGYFDNDLTQKISLTDKNIILYHPNIGFITSMVKEIINLKNEDEKTVPSISINQQPSISIQNGEINIKKVHSDQDLKDLINLETFRASERFYENVYRLKLDFPNQKLTGLVKILNNNVIEQFRIYGVYGFTDLKLKN
ncbi:MAG: amidohydrolase family protein [Promethearchaeota archaeon]